MYSAVAAMATTKNHSLVTGRVRDISPPYFSVGAAMQPFKRDKERVINMSNTKRLSLTVLADRYAIVRLDPQDDIPASLLRPIQQRQLLSITRSDRELSIVCPMSLAPASKNQSNDWACLEVDGPLEFSETGILARLSGLLAARDIPIFVVSSYDTDYLLVAADVLTRTIETLEGDGMAVARSS